ncbi:MAG: DUF1553 domain-containing protein [Pirellulaceae bacterium]|nr:DUF1553 domain-containing protein [Pirellulaceae bacterium]
MYWKNLLLLLTIVGIGFYVGNQLLPGENDRLQPSDRNELTEIQNVASQIDEQFIASWQTSGIESTFSASERLVARRLSLGLTGTIPSLEEIRMLDHSPSEARIDRWVNYLLNDKRFHDFFAERFARALVGTEDGPFIVFRRRRFVLWLSEQLKANRPYDELVRSLIKNNGLWTDTPSVNFYTVTIDNNENKQPDPIRLAARTSRAFLGLRIDCLQCHDDALGTLEFGSPNQIRSGTQQDFHQLAAAFSSVRQTAAGLQDTIQNQDYRYQFLDEYKETVVEFKVPFRRDLIPQHGTHREKLASWITHKENRAFSRAIVNRVWGLLFGTPLVKPVDDIPFFESHPLGLDLLASDFADNGYDLWRLIRIIAQTKTFQTSSVASFPITEKHENLFAIFPQTPLRPEQVVGSLVQASSLKTINDQSTVLQKLMTFGDINDFIQRYGDSGEDEFLKRNGTIQQKNIMMNGKVVSERSNANGLMLNSAGQIAAMADSDAAAINSLFLITLSRLPTALELDYLCGLFTGQNHGERQRIIEDILWSLFNKEEFQINH